MKLRPYVAIDIETTGLDVQKSQILEIAAIYDDFQTPVDQLPVYNHLVHYDVITYGEPQALSMNRNLLYSISKRESTETREICNLQNMFRSFLGFVFNNSETLNRFEEANPVEGREKDLRVHLAGKAAPSFDWPIFRNQLEAAQFSPGEKESFLTDIEKYIHFWIIDVGSLYVVDFGGKIPPMNEINRLLDRPKVAHKALSDARDVVCAMRHKFGVPF